MAPRTLLSMGALGKRLFLSYRSDDYSLAAALAQRLVDGGYVDSAIVIPPERIARRREVLLVYDYFELMEFIVDQMVDCDAFGFIERDDHWASYWTQQELTQWRRMPKPQSIFGVSNEGLRKYDLGPMDPAEKRLLARLSIGTRRPQPSHRPAASWSRFARTCFLVQCPACGRNLVVSQKAVYASIRGRHPAPCAWCDRPLLFQELPERGNFYRKRILLTGGPAPQAPLLAAPELQTLLVSNDLPQSVRLVKLEGEQLLSDLETVGNLYTLGMYGLLKRLVGGKD